MATAILAPKQERFWQRMAIGLSLFITFAFLQFSLRGIVDPINAPFWVHLHGLIMLSWLLLMVVQPTFVSRENRALHRQLGWIGAGLATVMVGLGIFTGIAAIAMQRFAPFFPPAYFLALTFVESLVFGAMVLWAIRKRRATDWHRRLMMGATIIILEPALGRLLPPPLLVEYWDIPVGICQLAVVGIIAAYDRRTMGRIHPATIRIAVVIVAMRATIQLLSVAPPVIDITNALMGK